VTDDELWNPKDKNEKVAIDLGNKYFLRDNSAYFSLLGGERSVRLKAILGRVSPSSDRAV
jgi:hypothetical protein